MNWREPEIIWKLGIELDTYNSYRLRLAQDIEAY